MMEPFLQYDLAIAEGLSSSFHQHLLETLSDLSEQLEQLTMETDSRASSSQNDCMSSGLLEVLDSYNYAMVGLNTFLHSLDTEAATLDAELENIEAKRNTLLLERDVLIEKGHELNCRLAYNALVRKLDESFTSLEKNTSEESAKCFRDEAEEHLKRTNELIRIGSKTSCGIDRDIFKEMEKITNLFENYERDRNLYVKELDLFSDVRRQKISSWMAEPRTSEETKMGENVLDFLNLTQRQRHMEVQIIKNALRMYSFNASLNFDREDNLRLMDELSNLQNKVNAMSGISKILPRAAKARTDLTNKDDAESLDEPDKSAGDADNREKKGKGLHQCPRKTNLATDPVDDPEIVQQLEDVLRWEEISINTQMSGPTDSLSEYPDQAVTLSDSTTEIALKTADSTCGDVNVIVLPMEPSMEITATDDGKPLDSVCECKQTNSHSFLHHIESSTVQPGSAEMKIVGLVWKKNVKSVSSLTNVMDIEISNQKSSLNNDERNTRSQGNEPAPRSTTATNKSRDHVQSGWSSTSEHKKNVGESKDTEDKDDEEQDD